MAFWAFLLLFSCAQAPDPYHILVITGGHGFERDPFFEMLKDMKSIEYTEAVHPEANSLYGSGVMENIDVLVFYDMVQEITESQKNDFLSLTDKGKGMVFLHHSLASYQDWEDFETLIGGHYYLNPVLKDSIPFPRSTYKHDEQIPVRILDKTHPVTQGLPDFTLFDEVYGDFRVLPSVHPLLGTTHPGSGPVIGWAHTLGKSRIVMLQSGHGPETYRNPHFRKLLKQAIAWAAQ